MDYGVLVGLVGAERLVSVCFVLGVCVMGVVEVGLLWVVRCGAEVPGRGVVELDVRGRGGRELVVLEVVLPGWVVLKRIVLNWVVLSWVVVLKRMVLIWVVLSWVVLRWLVLSRGRRMWGVLKCLFLYSVL